MTDEQWGNFFQYGSIILMIIILVYIAGALIYEGFIKKQTT